MRWIIDWLLRKFYLISTKVFFFLLGITFQVILFLFTRLYRFLLFCYDSLPTIFGSYYPGVCKLAIFVADCFLFFVASIPYFFYRKLFKPICTNTYIFIITLFKRYAVLDNLSQRVLRYVHSNSPWIKLALGDACKRVYKFFIDFLFFKVHRNRVMILNAIHVFLINLVRLFLLYIFLYCNLWNFLHNRLFLNYSANFAVWNLDSYEGMLYIFITFLNIDNVIMFLYMVIFDIGLSTIFNNAYQEIYLLLGARWLDYYDLYKIDDLDFSFFFYFYCMFTYTIENFVIDFTCLSVFYNSISSPFFFYFGSLFFSTVIFSWFFFSYLGLYGVFKLNVVSLVLFWVSLLFEAKSILVLNKIHIIKLSSWIFLSANTKLDYYFLIDSISFSFMLLTTTIALFVFVYAFSYFRYEPLVDRFLLLLLSFVISMLFLVASGNTIMLFLGWELIGLTSFLLINFWTTKVATLKSAFKAFSFNKVSDFFMFMFLVTTYSTFYTVDILSLNQLIYRYEYSSMYILGTPINLIEFIGFMVIGAAFVKSAQFGGHAWLPDSMEAPVPASSLIHSATLVSAGIYLILRFNFIFDCTQYGKLIVPVMGSVTAAYGGVCAAAQSDIKKTLAYSTISHCGFLMVLCATEMNEFTILYLYVHGFFKAGIFMCVGNVLRITRGYQDTRRMGALLKHLPFEYFCVTIGLLNLAGLPFTFGFFIKHLLLLSLDTHVYLYGFVIFNSLVGAFSGLFYSFKIINYTFCDFKKGSKILYLNTNNSSYNSILYTNSSLAATLSIFFLFISSYVITYFMFVYLLSGNFLFSDYVNTTILSNYYATTSVFEGYLLNFSYINITVLVIFLALFFSKFRRTQRIHVIYNWLSILTVFFIFFFLFFNLI